MNAILRNALAVAGLAVTSQAMAQVTFYENEGFQGRSFTTQEQLRNFERQGFNDRASSVVVARGQWEVCEDARFQGQCVVLRPGRYPSLAALGLNNSISSVRTVSGTTRFDENRYAPGAYDYRRRSEERLFQADVTSVRAVVGQAEQRCWIEREQVQGSSRNVPGAIAGALIGGILGHQIGGGRGQDLATAGGAVAGGVVGSNVGRSGGNPSYAQNVQRCENVPSQTPSHWDVTYNFRGQDHRMQMNSPPGRTVTVNAQGEPRA